jgi:hypothetical protein
MRILCLVGTMSSPMEKLRTTIEHQFAVYEFGFPRHPAEADLKEKDLE